MTDPIPTTDITPPRAPRTRKPRPEPDRELAVMAAVVAALDSLSDDAARRRVVHYLTDRTGFQLPEATLERTCEPLPCRPVPIPLAPPADGEIRLSDAVRERLASLPDVSGLSGVFDGTTGTPVSDKCVEMLRPSAWLARDYPDVKILDCDGWKPDEWDTPCTETEFARRLAKCTVQANVKPPAVNPFAVMPAFPRTNPPAERQS